MKELSRFNVRSFQRLAPFAGLAFEDCSRCIHSFKLLSAFLKCGRFGKEQLHMFVLLPAVHFSRLSANIELTIWITVTKHIRGTPHTLAQHGVGWLCAV